MAPRNAHISPFDRSPGRIVATLSVCGLAIGPGILALVLLRNGVGLASIPRGFWAVATIIGGGAPVLVYLLWSVVHPANREQNALFERAASGDHGAAAELFARRKKAVAALRQQAQSSRPAARKYLEHLKSEIEALRELEQEPAARDDPDLLRQLRVDIRQLESELARLQSPR